MPEVSTPRGWGTLEGLNEESREHFEKWKAIFDKLPDLEDLDFEPLIELLQILNLWKEGKDQEFFEKVTKVVKRGPDGS